MFTHLFTTLHFDDLNDTTPTRTLIGRALTVREYEIADR